MVGMTTGNYHCDGNIDGYDNYLDENNHLHDPMMILMLIVDNS